jgi:hypothetical protein
MFMASSCTRAGRQPDGGFGRTVPRRTPGRALLGGLRDPDHAMCDG